ncbi:Protein with predicted involvement in meiosis (GSG1) [Ceraceosorus bombacis]|uniref:Protein with predicted involvement in meiosis (GSG1) n=1 Tax=Ceraceosorus bombacis TaxID=401625 RepID=A0A0P1BDA1_9BASI|nr:Protein with predicted involvement in meiosis (GSG1) [Ceraceosorus bombacis]
MQRPSTSSLGGHAQTFATRGEAAQHIVHSALSPRLAVLASPDVDKAILRPNGVPDLAALLRPFEASVRGLTIRTTELASRLAPSFTLRFDAISAFAPPRSSKDPAAASASATASSSAGPGLTSQIASNVSSPPPTPGAPTQSRPGLFSRSPSVATSLARDTRPEAILDSLGPAIRKLAGRSSDGKGDEKDELDQEEMDKEDVTPWYALVRDEVLGRRNVESHETFGWPIGMILAVSSASPDPMNAFAALFEASNPQASRAYTDRPYMDSTLLRYYVLIHDVRTSGSDLTESLALLDTIKKTYGVHACLLPLNSAVAGAGSIETDLAGIWEQALRVPPTAPPPRRYGPATGIAPPLPPKDDESDPAMQKEVVDVDEQTEVSRYATALNEEDVARLQAFVRELAAQSVVPFLERTAAQWNESLAASRRGITGRLFGAGRKLFGSGSGSIRGSSSTPSFSTLGYYPPTSLEAQTRRLADFAFMTRDYKLAASMYDLGRKDYSNDKALKHLAGATEMFGLSHLMMMLTMKSQPIDVDSYLASACAAYAQAPRQRGSHLQLDGLRATLLYYEIYRSLNFYQSAPAALMRAAGVVSNDVSSPEGIPAENIADDVEVIGAVLLEQAALADLHQQPQPHRRKHAAHLVMASHRYQECGQNTLSLRCLRRAARQYASRAAERQPVEDLLESLETKSSKDDQGGEGPELDVSRAIREKGQRDDEPAWDAVETHVEHELGQRAYANGDSVAAIKHFTKLIRPAPLPFDATDEDVAAQQAKHNSYLNAFLTAFKYVDAPVSTDEAAEALALDFVKPLWDPQTARIITRSTRASDAQWEALETKYMSLASAAGLSRPSNLTPEERNVCQVDESFHIQVLVRNLLSTSLTLESASVGFELLQGEKVDAQCVHVESIGNVELGPDESRLIVFEARSSKPQSLRANRVEYLFAGAVPMSQRLHKRGKRLNATREQRVAPLPVYAPDESLAIHVLEAQPALSVQMTQIRDVIGLGEEVEVSLQITNTGSVELTELACLCDAPAVLLLAAQLASDDFAPAFSAPNKLEDTLPTLIPLPNGALASGASAEIPIRLRGASIGVLEPKLLFVFKSANASKYFTVISPRWKASTGQDAALEAALKNIPFRHHAAASIAMSEASAEELSAANVEPLADLTHTTDQLGLLLQNMPLKSSPKNIALRRSTIGTSQQPVSPFLSKARSEWRQKILLQQFPVIDASDRARAFTLYQPSDVDVIAHWAIGERRGQAFIFGLQLGPAHDQLLELTSESSGRVIYAEAAKERATLLAAILRSRLHVEEDPVVVEVQSEDQISHDFAKSRLRHLAVVDVRNLSTVRTVEYSLNLENGPVERLTAPGTTPASWVGRMTQRGKLPPRGRARFEAYAMLPSPGAYELGAWALRSRTLTSAQEDAKVVGTFSQSEWVGITVQAGHAVDDARDLSVEQTSVLAAADAFGPALVNSH